MLSIDLENNLKDGQKLKKQKLVKHKRKNWKNDRYHRNRTGYRRIEARRTHRVS
jgi:hypothetical protein